MKHFFLHFCQKKRIQTYFYLFCATYGRTYGTDTKWIKRGQFKKKQNDFHFIMQKAS